MSPSHVGVIRFLRARRWARAWKKTATITRAALRLQLRITDRQGLDILELEGALRPLVQALEELGASEAAAVRRARELLGETK